MRQVAKRGILTVVAASSMLASTAGYAYASADALGGAANSPGVGSGNSVQAPVSTPVNACGNTVDGVGVGNPAFGDSCGDVAPSGPSQTGTGASSAGGAHGSPGVASGDNVQAPVDVQGNACDDSVDGVGVGNPAFGDSCGNIATHPTPPPSSCDDTCPADSPSGGPSEGPNGGPSGGPSGGPNGGPSEGPSGGPNTQPPSGTPSTTRSNDETPSPSAGPGTKPVSATGARLASTGSSGLEGLAPVGAALLLAGGVLYRRARAVAR